ncbi:MAG: HD domain-containing phosphohydrolase [Candidatus Omnitrophota bacterium]
MKKYEIIFPSFHAVYRLATTLNDLKSFASGVCRVYRNAFQTNKIVMICKNPHTQGFLKIRVEGKKQYVKKGGISILTKREKEILKQEKEVVLSNRLIYPFVFTDTLGVVYIKRASKIKDFSEVEQKWFLALCEEVSIGLKIFCLCQEQQKIISSYMKSLSKFLNQYVPTSYLHVKAISRLIKTMGKAMELSEAETKSLEHAALLHDAGKMQVPSKLLKKQKPLTDEEFRLIAKHPQDGAGLIKDFEILKPAIPIILHHHERYDGTGYPSKLKKEKIPLGSRILSILDTFDAMYFGRPYKESCSLEEIIEEFKKQRGKQFDPRIVDVFIKILKRKSTKKYLNSNTQK